MYANSKHSQIPMHRQHVILAPHTNCALQSLLLFSLHVQSGSQSFILTGDPNPLVVPTPSSKPKLSASHANLPSVKASGKDLWLNTQCRR